MNANLVAIEVIANGGVAGKLAGKAIKIAHIVDALLELADEAGRKTCNRQITGKQFVGNKEMLMRRSGCICLVDGHFQLVAACAGLLGERARYLNRMGKCAAILGERAL
jgi:hypothetical protein